ncbi:anchor protein [Opitutaceae bacterium TAV5]|nr:anchor protein [Opitutaceae bacterium TAV5]
MKTHIKNRLICGSYLRPLAFVFAFITAAATTPAAVVASYDFEGANLAAALTSHTAATGIDASDVVLNNNSSNSSILTLTSPLTSQALVACPGARLTAFSFSSALTNASYVSFKIKVKEGYTLSLDSFAFEAASGATSGTGGVRAFYLLSSVTGFEDDTSNILKQDWAGDNDGVTGTLKAKGSAGPLGAYSVTLTDPDFNNAFQNFTSGEEVEFRLYFQTNGTNISVVFDNVVFNGTITAVPEPAAISLFAALGAAALGLVVRHRRKNRA